MNERIKELALQAGYLPDSFGIGHWDMPECKNLLELIVLECARVSKNYSAFRRSSDGYTVEEMPLSIASIIKEHFGVEE